MGVGDAPGPLPAALLPRTGGVPRGFIGEAATCTELSDYGEAALRSAASKILTAPNGEQEVTLNGESFSIGRLAGSGGVPAALALDILLTAAKAIPSYDPRRPWRPGEVEAKVRSAFAQGTVRPRASLAEIMAELDRLFAGVGDG